MHLMRIALLTYSTKPRGSVMHTLELAAAFTELGHQVCIYALDKDGTGFDGTVPCAVRLVPAYPAPTHLDALIQQRVQEFVDAFARESEEFDIYHAQDCIGANALLILKQQGKILYFARTVHHIEQYQSPYLQDCQDKSIRRPDLCFCVSQYWQQRLKQLYGIAAPQVFNGINLQRFSSQPSGSEAEVRQKYGLTNSPIFLTVGGIEPRKNSICLIQAFAQVLTKFPTAQLVIAGGATLFDYQSYRDAFFQEVKTCGIDIGRSLFLPGLISAEELPILYRCADVFCFPSIQEGWGLVVFEAIASGLPVVVSQQPPFTEFLQPDQVYWVDPQVPETLANAMERSLANVLQPQSKHQTYPNPDGYLQHYSWKRTAQLHLNHYQQLIKS